MFDFKELLKKRRSIRNYEDKEISLEIINEILHDVCLAPSACNKQPWRFIVIEDKKMMKRISDENKKNLIYEIDNNPESRYKQFEKLLRNPEYNVFYNAPCLIMIVGENNYKWFYEDCALAVAYLMFSATNRELGTCWIGLGAHIKDPKIKEEIGLTDNYEIVAPVIIGYPKEIPEVASRKDPVILKVIS